MPASMEMEKCKLRIAVLSGKGGTGKTLVSVNLAAVAKEAIYIDCDVEEPNGHLFFKPKDSELENITIEIPYVNEDLCNGCRRCVDFCKFNALAYVGNKLIVFEEVCHSCGGCVLFCPNKALLLKKQTIGIVQKGSSENVTIISGIMNIGETSGVPIIKKLINMTNNIDMLTFIDCPPGSSCVVMESIREADYCILVAEPTLFGVHNLNMVNDLVKLFDKPSSVIINKCLDEGDPVEKFCFEKGIKIIGKIPFDHELGFFNSKAIISVRESNKYRYKFSWLLETVMKEAEYETIIDT